MQLDYISLVHSLTPLIGTHCFCFCEHIRYIHCNELTSFGFIHWPSWCEPTDHVPCFREQNCTAVVILTILVPPNTIQPLVVRQWKEIKCSFEVSMISMSGFYFSQSLWHQTRSSLQWWDDEKKLNALLRFQWEVCLGFTSHNPRDTKHDQASLSRLSRQKK